MPGIGLDDRGRGQAAAVGARLADVPLDAIISSPLQRCRETAAAIAAARNGHQVAVTEDDRFAEVAYGDWTGKPIKRLAKEPLWRVVQAHPSAVRFPGPGGESLPGVQERAVAAIRDWNARLGPKAVYLVCSHGDVIKSIIADSLGLHLDMFQRIQVDPCSVSLIRYTPLRPFVLRMNDTGAGMGGLAKAEPAAGGPGQPGGAGRRAVWAGRGRCGYWWRGGRIGTWRSTPTTLRSVSWPGRSDSLGSAPSTCRPAPAGRVTSVVVEKFQVSLLAERIDELLDEVLSGTGGAPGAAGPADDGPLDLPLTEDFRVGAIALGWDGEEERVVIEAQEETENPIEPLAEDVPENGPGVLRVRLSPAAARAFSRRAIQIVGQGRPPCPLCGLPLDAEGHICPRQNGHRVSNA